MANINEPSISAKRYTSAPCTRCAGKGHLANEVREGGVCFACGGSGKKEAAKFFFGITQEAESGFVWKAIVRAYDEADAVAEATRHSRKGCVLKVVKITKKIADDFCAKFDQMYVKRPA